MPKLSYEDSKRIYKIFASNFINYFRIIFELDQKAADNFKARNMFFYHKKHEGKDNTHSGDCCSKYYSKICIPQEEMTRLESIVKERLSFAKLLYDFPVLFEKLASSFSNIKNSGKKDALNWDLETERFVLNEVLKEGILRFLVAILQKEITKEQNSLFNAQMLIATPNSWKEKFPKVELQFLNSKTFAKLMTRKFAKQKSFFTFSESVHNELCTLERLSNFEEAMNEKEIRNDRLLWASLSDINEANECRLLCDLFVQMAALPFEINAKANLGVQVAENFQISFFKGEGFHHKHLDSTFSHEKENAKKFTVIFVVSKFEEANVKFYSFDGQTFFQKIELIPGTLIIFSSREISYEIESKGKGFLVRQWINGPFN